MAEKKKTSTTDKLFKVVDAVGKVHGQVEGLIDGTFQRIDEARVKIMNNVEETRIRIVNDIVLISFLLLGTIFVLVGIAVYIPDRFSVSEGLGFVFVGLFLLAVGFIFKAVRSKHEGQH